MLRFQGYVSVAVPAAFVSLISLLAIATPSAASNNKCRTSTSTPVSVEEIASDPYGFVDECVTVTGLATGDPYHRNFYSDTKALYRGARGERDRHRVGLLGSEDDTIVTPTRITVTGRVDTCRRIGDRAQASAGPDEIVMLGGYCHYTYGAVIIVDSHRVDASHTYERMVGEQFRRSFGNIIPAPRTRTVTLEAKRAAGDLITAVHKQDRATLLRLLGYKEDPGQLADEEIGPILESGSPLSGLPPQPQTAFFIRRHEKPSETETDAIETLTCFCRTADCTGRWPISTIDLAYRLGRPYLCVWHAPDSERLRFVASGETLAEPPRTKFRPE